MWWLFPFLLKSYCYSKFYDSSSNFQILRMHTIMMLCNTVIAEDDEDNDNDVGWYEAPVGRDILSINFLIVLC